MKRFASLLVLVTLFLVVRGEEPKVHVYGLPGNRYATGISHNGRYAIMSSVRDDNSLYDYYGTLIDLQTGVVTDLSTPEAEVYGANSVSDDGIVAGCFGEGMLRSNPAIWSAGNGWRLLPYPAGEWEGGIVSCITPGGRYAVGKVYKQAMMWEEPVLWELGENPRVVETPGVPYKNRYGENEHQTRFNSITADGRLISGTVSFSYMGSWSFIYDRENERVFTATQDYVNERFVNRVTDKSLGGAHFSTDGKYYFGSASWRDENGVSRHGYYRHEIATDICTLIEAESLESGMVSAMDDNGTLYGSTPGDMPVRDWYVLSNGYWIGFDQILRQVYGKELADYTGYDNSRTGTVMGVSGDGKTLGLLVYYPSGESYVVQLPESAAALAAKVNLLDDYSVAPHEDAAVSHLRDFEFTFTRDLTVYGGNDAVVMLDDEGDVVARSVKVAVSAGNNKKLEISFRKFPLKEGKEYRLYIAPGVFGIRGDESRKNGEIYVTYQGRKAAPVAVTGVTPTPGIAMLRFTASSNPVIVTFDTELRRGDGKGEFLLVENDTHRSALCDLAFMADGNRLVVWPTMDQNLFKGGEYILRIGGGVVTDIVGENGNEEFEIGYSGLYEPEFNPDDVVLFSNDFDDGSWVSAFLFYEGDHNQPAPRMQGWNFLDGDSYPWWWVRDTEESPDYALASHSMYTPAGKSDDRCVIPRMYIPDENCRLNFKSQGYLKNKRDRLKVYVWATDLLLSSINDEMAGRMADEWQLIYDEVQDPGEHEETMEGEWRENSLSLADYAGKHVYIAFVNENENQSALFIDDVSVTRNLDFTMQITTETTMVGAKEAIIKGKIRVENPESVSRMMSLTLRDEDDVEIESMEISGEDLETGSIVDFEFESPLPLAPGRENGFRVSLQSGENIILCRGNITNLLFAPEKRVVLEEGTGMGCPNCPQGFAMIDLLRETYGDRIIPISLRTYTGDPLGGGVKGVSEFLGINAYPSGVIDRDGAPLFPMKGGVNGAVWSDAEDPMWWDKVAERINEIPVAEISHQMEDEDIDYVVENGGKIWIPVMVRYALDRLDVNDYLLNVLVEDGISGYQSNGMYGYDWPILGEWGQGGAYGTSVVTNYLFDDVARVYYGTGYNGTPGLLPTAVTAGTSCYAVVSERLPGGIGSIENCHVVTMLIDGNTGLVINAVKSGIRHDSGIESASESASNSDVYSIDGKIVMRNATTEDLHRLFPGVYIYKGKKIVAP